LIQFGVVSLGTSLVDALHGQESSMSNRLGCVVCLMIVCVASSESPGAAPPLQTGSQLGVPQDPSAVGYLNLSKRHPDAADGPTEFASLYASGSALQRLDQVRGFLASFKQLTARTRGRLTETELRGVGNTSGEMQTIGFHNIPLIIEGTLLKQDYQLKQAHYELAQLRRTRGEITEQELDRLRGAYADATNRFQLFWDIKRPTD
jgi:hypothetical protein